MLIKKKVIQAFIITADVIKIKSENEDYNRNDDNEKWSRMHDAVKDKSNKNQMFIHGDSMVKHVKGWELSGS